MFRYVDAVMANAQKMSIEPTDSQHLDSCGARGAAAKIGRKMALAMSRWFIPALALFWLTNAWSGARSDPTRPAPGWLAAQPNAQAAAAQAGQPNPPGVAPQAVQPNAQGMVPQEGQANGAGLQLILIGQTRKFAVIDGEVVKPGDIYNGSKVVRIDAGEVVVQDRSKSLKLNPEVEKKVHTPSPK